jgi:hypothetical protein
MYALPDATERMIECGAIIASALGVAFAFGVAFGVAFALGVARVADIVPHQRDGCRQTSPVDEHIAILFENRGPSNSTIGPSTTEGM